MNTAINISSNTPRLTIIGISLATDNDKRNIPFSIVIKPITFDKVAFNEIEQQMKEWGNGARACVCFKNLRNNRGHAIVVENVNGKIEFLDVQKGKYYNKKEAEILGYNDTLFFRTDNAIISTRGVNACEKE